MDLALQACKDGISKTKAAKEFNVPRKTLADRVNSKVLSEHPVLGNETTLSEEDEKALCSYIEYMATRSFPLTVDQVMKYAWSIDKRGKGKFGVNGPSQLTRMVVKL